MAGLEIGDSIANLTMTQLIRIIKDLFERDPPGLIGSTSIDNLTIPGKLILGDELQFTRDPNFHKIGDTGEPAFANSWVNWGSPYNPAGYWKDLFGFVHLRGVIKSGTINTTAFTLPAGFRPANTEIFDVISNGAIGRLEVSSGGVVTPVSGSNVYMSLDGKYFKAI